MHERSVGGSIGHCSELFGIPHTVKPCERVVRAETFRHNDFHKKKKHLFKVLYRSTLQIECVKL